MKHIFFVVTIASLLSACGGADLPESQSPGSNSASSSSSSSSSSSGIVNTTSGALLYAAKCANCHGDDGQGGIVATPIRNDFERLELVNIIDQRMPAGNTENCIGQCAEDIADYILNGYGGNTDGEPFACDATSVDPGPSPLRKLTALQYKNTAKSLFGDSVNLDRFFPGGASDQDIGNAVTSVSQVEVEVFAGAAKALSDHVAENVQRYAPCTKTIESANKAVWASGTTENKGTSLSFQGDGNLVLYNEASQPVWASHTNGKNANKFVLNDDGSLAIYADSQVVWSKGGAGTNASPLTETNSKNRLAAGERLTSTNGLHFFILQNDGNLVLYNKKLSLAGTACARDFLSTFGTRIFRSPLSETDITALLNVFDIGFRTQDYAKGIGLMVNAMLQAPRFIYIPELGVPSKTVGNAMPLSDYELATRLSFTFWNQTPDEILLTKVANGELATSEGLLAEVNRLTSDARANESFKDFMYVWLGLNELETVTKDTEHFPFWNKDTLHHMQTQTDAYFDDVLKLSIEDLFTLSHESYAPSALNDWYSNAAAPQLGLLTLPALLSTHSKSAESFPIYRGLFVRQHLLCSPLPPAPAGVGEPDPPSEGVSDRERFEQHSSDPVCQACHKAIDDLGFAFEHFDAAGRFREKQGVHTIDASGELTGTEFDGPFTGLADLSALLQNNRTVSSCVVQQWFRHTIRRPADKAVDGCSLKDMHTDLEASGNRFESLRASLIDTAAFRMRRTFSSEVVTP